MRTNVSPVYDVGEQDQCGVLISQPVLGGYSMVRGSFGPSFYENTRNLDPSAQRTFSSVKVAKFRRVFGPIL